MNRIKIFNRHLTTKSKIFLVIFFLMALSFLTFLSSPFFLIWSSWDIAWRIGATGLLGTITFILPWWFLYNSFFATLDAISNGQKRK